MDFHKTTKLLIPLIICLLAQTVRAQQVFVIDRIDLEDDKVIINYELNDDMANRQYLVQLFSSLDNFTSPFTKISGDAGMEVKPGKQKKIVWEATKELGNFSGSLSFEIRGRIYAPFVKLNNVHIGEVFKRGKNYPVTWISGNLSGQVNIELYKGDVRISGDNNQPNAGKYEWYIPGNIKRGGDYHLKFTNTKDRSDVVHSPPFIIKPRISFIVKTLGLILIGGGVTAAIIAGGNESASPGDTDLPGLGTQHP